MTIVNAETTRDLHGSSSTERVALERVAAWERATAVHAAVLAALREAGELLEASE